MVNKQIAVKIKRLRELKGMTQGVMALRAGLSRMAYNSIENGHAEPRTSNLYNISKALGVKIQDLIEPIPEMSEVRFRCGKCAKKKEQAMREEILTEVKIWLKNFCNLEDIMSEKKIFKYRLPADILDNPIECAKKARHEFGLDDETPINDICGLVESKGVRLYFFEKQFDKLNGLSLIFEKQYPAIAVNINTNIHVERKIFTIAHELGHLLMHRASFDVDQIDEIKAQEDQANIFASHFLMPDKAFEKKWNENKGLSWVDSVLEIKKYFKISYKTVLMRMIDKKISNESIYPMFAQVFKIKYKHNLKNHFEPFEMEKVEFFEVRLKGLVREAIEKELISVSRAAEILGISLEEMREKGRSWNPPYAETKSTD